MLFTHVCHSQVFTSLDLFVSLSQPLSGLGGLSPLCGGGGLWQATGWYLWGYPGQVGFARISWSCLHRAPEEHSPYGYQAEDSLLESEGKLLAFINLLSGSIVRTMVFISDLVSWLERSLKRLKSNNIGLCQL